MTSYLPSLLIPDAALTVASLTAHIQALLETDPQLQQIWVTGEVSSASRYRSGLFFTLQDPDAQAAISCVVWNSQINRLVATPQAGEQLVVMGRIHLHPQRGSYQLVIWQALPAGEGLRALRYRQLRHRLEAAGLFDADRKRSLPPHPQTVAVVTSAQAAAWGDIQRTLKRRYPGLRVLLSPALVQGDQAAESIVRAMRRVELDGRAEVLILSRGGGAVEDMACFNDERVVQAVAACAIPVVAGIGHQRDESLADLAADVCAHTPTAAAELAVPQLSDLREIHQARAIALQRAVQQQLRARADQTGRLRDRLHRLNLDHKLRQRTQALAWMEQRLLQSTHRHLQQATQHCELLQQKLQTLDPRAVLRRGYAVVRQTAIAPDTRAAPIVRTTDTLTPGQSLTIQLAQGGVRATVTEILPDADASTL